MADNTTLNVGSGGDVIATDDVSGVKHQTVKVEFGADGTATRVTSSAGLPVNIVAPLGQSADAASIPVVLPVDQITALTPPTNTGYSTSSKQDTGNTSLGSIDGKTPALGQALAAASVPVILPSATVTTLTPPSNTGYSTSAKQDTGNTSVGSIDTKTPALGQALAASSVPVVLPALQITTLTPPAAITGFALEAGNLATIAGAITSSKVQTNVAQIGGTNVVNGGVAGSQSVGGANATNVAITTNPINNGAQAVSSENSVVTTARMAQLVCDLVGKLIVLPYANPENFINGTTAAIIDLTSTSVIAAQSSGVRSYITNITVTNSHISVGTFVKILDGTNVLWEGYAAPNGGGAVINLGVALKGTAATAVNCQCVTTGANVIASCSGYKGV